jgi:hypothetical protein
VAELPRPFSGLIQVSHAQNAVHRVCFAKSPCALKIGRFPGAMAASSRLPLHPKAPRICPRGPERYTCINKGCRNPDMFATLPGYTKRQTSLAVFRSVGILVRINAPPRTWSNLWIRRNVAFDETKLFWSQWQLMPALQTLLRQVTWNSRIVSVANSL